MQHNVLQGLSSLQGRYRDYCRYCGIISLRTLLLKEVSIFFLFSQTVYDEMLTFII